MAPSLPKIPIAHPPPNRSRIFSFMAIRAPPTTAAATIAIGSGVSSSLSYFTSAGLGSSVLTRTMGAMTFGSTTGSGFFSIGADFGSSFFGAGAATTTGTGTGFGSSTFFGLGFGAGVATTSGAGLGSSFLGSSFFGAGVATTTGAGFGFSTFFGGASFFG